MEEAAAEFWEAQELDLITGAPNPPHELEVVGRCPDAVASIALPREKIGDGGIYTPVEPSLEQILALSSESTEDSCEPSETSSSND